MVHITIPRNIVSNMSKLHLWRAYKKNPKYWFMVSVSLIAAPSCAIFTGISKLTSYQYITERANVRLMHDADKYEKFLRSG